MKIEYRIKIHKENDYILMDISGLELNDSYSKNAFPVRINSFLFLHF